MAGLIMDTERSLSNWLLHYATERPSAAKLISFKSNVCVWMAGGLGNQLFQYAMGRALATRLGATLCLDITSYAISAAIPKQHVAQVKQNSTLRCYELREHFGLQTPTFAAVSPMWAAYLYRMACQAERLSPFSQKLYRKLLRRAYKLQDYFLRMQLRYAHFTYFREPHYHYAPAWEQLSGNVYLEGYWQSSRYFSNIEADVRKDLSLSRFASPRTAPLLAEIDQPGSVSVHFRLGDYRQNEWVQPMAYYIRALQLLTALIQNKNLRLYIFSDDVDGLLPLLPEMLQDKNYFVVSGKKYSAHEEMLLISRCEHHIMSNSTYSWWAIWLHDIDQDPRPGQKYVIAPRIWGPSHAHIAFNTKDFYCENWILV